MELSPLDVPSCLTNKQKSKMPFPFFRPCVKLFLPLRTQTLCFIRFTKYGKRDFCFLDNHVAERRLGPISFFTSLDPDQVHGVLESIPEASG